MSMYKVCVCVRVGHVRHVLSYSTAQDCHVAPRLGWHKETLELLKAKHEQIQAVLFNMLCVMKKRFQDLLKSLVFWFLFVY